MTLLKKIGVIALNITGIIAGIGPIASVMYPNKAGEIVKVVDTVNQFAAIIAQVEVFGAALSLPGTDKFKAAIPAIGQAVAMTDLVIKHKIKDQALYQKAVAGYAQATVDLLNSLDDNGVKSESLVA